MPDSFYFQTSLQKSSVFASLPVSRSLHHRPQASTNKRHRSIFLLFSSRSNSMCEITLLSLFTLIAQRKRKGTRKGQGCLWRFFIGFPRGLPGWNAVFKISIGNALHQRTLEIESGRLKVKKSFGLRTGENLWMAFMIAFRKTNG